MISGRPFGSWCVLLSPLSTGIQSLRSIFYGIDRLGRVQVSFTQHPLKLELQQFFITFSACFLSLLLAAAIMWKIKQKYDLYRRRQRLFVEMEQMASRPFSHVLVELHVPPFGVAPARPPLHHSQVQRQVETNRLIFFSLVKK